MRKRGFSLAETMIVLTIMAVVAAISIPVVISSLSSNNKTLYKSAFRLMENVVNELVSDISIYPTGNITMSSFCTNVTNKVNYVGTPSCSTSTIAGTPNFITTNGMRWYGLDSTKSFTNDATYCATGTKCVLLEVDVDGQGKGKNVNTTSDDARDIMRIVLYETGKLTAPDTLEANNLIN
ncbi:MAG: prepilin-type N-terminal cleavage/methylation domain-containing protein [Candidatus Gastranaerophilales bacterium]|nr:prepilin-type N-terminal cleavage/methylation domain-containing protein [Candidatus Gastranaerophilales bacterium]